MQCLLFSNTKLNNLFNYDTWLSRRLKNKFCIIIDNNNYVASCNFLVFNFCFSYCFFDSTYFNWQFCFN